MTFLIVIIVTFSLYSLTTVDCPADYGGVSVLDGSESWSLPSNADSLPPPDDVTKVLQSGRYPYYHHINLLQYHGYHGTSTSSSSNTTFTLQVWNIISGTRFLSYKNLILHSQIKELNRDN